MAAQARASGEEKGRRGKEWEGGGGLRVQSLGFRVEDFGSGSNPTQIKYFGCQNSIPFLKVVHLIRAPN